MKKEKLNAEGRWIMTRKHNNTLEHTYNDVYLAILNGRMPCKYNALIFSVIINYSIFFEDFETKTRIFTNCSYSFVIYIYMKIQ